MRFLLISLFIPLALAACIKEEVAIARSDDDAPVTLILQGPTSVQLPKVIPEPLDYRLTGTDVRLVFTNTTNRSISFPGQAIVQQVIRRYRDRATGREQFFNINEPPSNAPQFISLRPGESWSYGFGFEYPDRLFSRDVPVWPLQVCALWDESSLDTALYPGGSYDWADGFEACFEVTVGR